MAALFYNEHLHDEGKIMLYNFLNCVKNAALRQRRIHICAFYSGIALNLFVVGLLISTPAFAGISFENSSREIQTPFVPGKYRALIIGNNNYKDPKKTWQPLNTPVSDALALENLLREHYGFSDITRLQNASRKDILYALREISDRVLPNDSVLIFYAGHGYLDQDTQKGYWIPVDANGADYTTYLRNSTIRDEISIIADRSKHTLLISDSCFSGSLLRRGASIPNLLQKSGGKEKRSNHVFGR